ncbi:MAG: alpha/beta fold hydrolase [Myxococcota bacterium]
MTRFKYEDPTSPLQLHDADAELSPEEVNNIIATTKRVLPIIFLPGIMGSRLCYRQGDEEYLVWNPRGGRRHEAHKQTPGVKKNTRAIKALSDPSIPLEVAYTFTHLSETPQRPEEFVARHPWLVYNSYELVYPGYQPFLSKMVPLFKRLSQKGWFLQVFCCGYDWRNSCLESATRFLSPRVDRLIETHGERPIIIAHSMGGLVARSYIHGNGGADKVRALILCGSPNFGATMPYHYLKAGIPLSPTDKGFEFMMAILAAVMLRKPTPGSITEFCRGVPGLYELVAREPYLRLPDKASDWILYDHEDTDLDRFKPPGPDGRPPPRLGTKLTTATNTYDVLLDSVLGLMDYAPSPKYSVGSRARTEHLVSSLKRLDRVIFDTSIEKRPIRDADGNAALDEDGHQRFTRQQRVYRGRFHSQTLFAATITKKTHVGDRVTLDKILHDPVIGNTFKTTTRSIVMKNSGDTSVPTQSAIPPLTNLCYPDPTDPGTTYIAWSDLTLPHGDICGDESFRARLDDLIVNMVPDLSAGD